MIWWINARKLYEVGTERWWCGSCAELTAIERNPEWDGQLVGEGDAPPWFVRCAVCHHKHWAPSEFDCPECGWSDDSDDGDAVLWMSKTRYNRYKAEEFGGNPVDWDEVVLCQSCGGVYCYTNSNC